MLATARWLLEPAELPGRDSTQGEWDVALDDWRIRRRTPQRVFLAEDDRRPCLDLDQAGHRSPLRQHLNRDRPALLVEARAAAHTAGAVIARTRSSCQNEARSSRPSGRASPPSDWVTARPGSPPLARDHQRDTTAPTTADGSPPLE
ncbi:lantibiotic dehydratase, partial [Streptomyces phaeofaciens]